VLTARSPQHTFNESLLQTGYSSRNLNLLTSIFILTMASISVQEVDGQHTHHHQGDQHHHHLLEGVAGVELDNPSPDRLACAGISLATM
jgi:hypothetical protein